jgi:hypothetical protein
MKHIKLFEDYDYSVYDGMEDDIESILVELKDFGLDYRIDHQSGMSESISISITSIDEDGTFWLDNRLYERLLFLTEYLTKKYPDIIVQVKDDFLLYMDFPFDIEEFSDEVMEVSIRIYYGE